MIPAVIGEVVKLLKHDMEAVRKRAVSALHRLYQMDKFCIRDHVDKIRRALCDKGTGIVVYCILFEWFCRSLCDGCHPSPVPGHDSG